MQRIEARLGKPMDAILREKYVDDGKTVEQVAAELGITKGSVSRWLQRFGIDARRQGGSAATTGVSA